MRSSNSSGLSHDTVDGCEILRHKKVGWNPNKIVGCLPPSVFNWCRVSKSPIHSITMNSHHFCWWKNHFFMVTSAINCHKSADIDIIQTDVAERTSPFCLRAPPLAPSGRSAWQKKISSSGDLPLVNYFKCDSQSYCKIDWNGWPWWI